MYPRNAASPPPVLVGQVVQISDGAVQTSGASVRVRTGTGSWGAGAGTLACDATSGFWDYAPTQAETNAESFEVAVYKASCFGCGQSVVTSANSTAGVPSDSSGTTTLLSRLSSARAGYLDNLSEGAVALHATLLTVAGYLDTEIAAILEDTGTTIPAQIAALSIPTAAAIADAVWDEDVVTEHQTTNMAGWSLNHIHGMADVINGLIDTEVAAIKAKTDQLTFTVANQVDSNALTVVGTVDDAILAAIAALNNISTANVTASVTTALTTALAEGYRADGSTGSVRDLLYELIAHMGEASIVSTTKTIKKIDGSTTAATYTLDSGSAPTSITRAS
jgi:hypothetical protein